MANTGFKFEITGHKELIKLLDELPTVSMKKTVMRNAIKKSLKPIERAAIDNAPHSGLNKKRHLKDSIKVSTSLKKSQKKGKWSDRNYVTVYVGSTAPHAHLVEFGTSSRDLQQPRLVPFPDGTFKWVTNTGIMPPHPFMRPAWDAFKMQALQIFAKEMEVELMKAAKRLAQRAQAGKLTASQIKGLQR